MVRETRTPSLLNNSDSYETNLPLLEHLLLYKDKNSITNTLKLHEEMYEESAIIVNTHLYNTFMYYSEAFFECL